MGNLFASFNTGVSGLRSAQTSLYTTAHNLSNATTEGHTRQQVMVADAFYTTRYGVYANRMQIGMGTDVVQIRQVRNTFLDAQYRLQVSRESFYEAQYKAVTEIEEVFGEMEGEEFLKVLSKDLWEALSTLQKEPGNIVYRSELVSTASQFVERARVLQNQLYEYQRNMNEEVQQQVDAINNIVSQIKDYNILIRKYECTGEGANDYRDARNLLLDQLSSYINFRASEEVDGTISIISEGNYLLETNMQYKLTTEYESDTSPLLKPVWEVGGDFFRRGELSYAVEDNSDTGSLRGLLVARGGHTTNYTDMPPQRPKAEDYTDDAGVLDESAFRAANKKFEQQVEYYNTYTQPSIIMTVQAEFDQLIHGVVTMINDMFCPNKEITLDDGTTMTVLDTDTASIGDDVDKTMGTELFVRRGTPRYIERQVTIGGKNVTVYEYNAEKMPKMPPDPTQPEDLTYRYSLYSIEQLEINPELLRDPSKMPLNANPLMEFADGFAWDLCTDILNKWQDDFATLDPNSMTTYDFNGYYTALVGQFGLQGDIWRGILENQELTVHSIESERQKVMGVATDEELSDLIKFQQCYNASSRYITVVDEMIEHLITHL